MAWDTLLGVAVGAVLAVLGGRMNRRFEVQRETQARMFEQMQVVRQLLGEAYRNPTGSMPLHHELTQIFRWSVLADRHTHEKARRLMELERKRARILDEETGTDAYGRQRDLDVVARQAHEDVIQQISQAVEMLDEHLGDCLRRRL